MLLFIAAGRIKAESAEDMEAAIREFLPQVESEEGTLAFIIYRGTDDPHKLVFYEQYRDQDAKTAHNQTEYLRRFLEVLRTSLEGEGLTGFFEEYASIER